MNTPLDLKNLERKAWTSFYQDGLWDIYMGLLLLDIGILSTMVYGIESRWLAYLLYFVIFGGVWLLFWAGRHFITMPRLGRVKFGAERRRKKLHLALIMSAFLLLNILLLFLTKAANNNPDTWGRFMPEGLPMWLFAGVYVGAVMAFIAYFNDFMRGYYIAVVFALAIACIEFFSSALGFWIGSALIIIPGVVLLVRFLQQHPLPPKEVTHDQSGS